MTEHEHLFGEQVGLRLKLSDADCGNTEGTAYASGLQGFWRFKLG